jgi:hypothetical protein
MLGNFDKIVGTDKNQIFLKGTFFLSLLSYWYHIFTNYILTLFKKHQNRIVYVKEKICNIHNLNKQTKTST